MDGLTIPEVADALGVGPREVRMLIEEGRLPATEIAGRWRVPEAEVERLARRPGPQGGPGGPSREEEIGLRRELSALQRRVAMLEDATQELTSLRRRVEDLEGRLSDSGPARLRPALTPLFRGPDAET